MTDPATIVAVQVEDLKAMQAARRRPLDVLLMECVLAVAAGAALGFLVAMLLQGFRLYDGLHVPGLIELWPWRST